MGCSRDQDRAVRDDERAHAVLVRVDHLNRISALLADPDLDVRWRTVRVVLSSHDAGGITETRKIAAMAESYDVGVALHCPLGLGQNLARQGYVGCDGVLAQPIATLDQPAQSNLWKRTAELVELERAGF